MSNWELASEAIQNPGMRIRNKGWREDEFIYFDRCLWRNQSDESFFPGFNRENEHWEEYKEPEKVVTWVRPKEIWREGDSAPESVFWKWGRSKKDFNNSVIDRDFKIVSWEVMKCPNKYDNCVTDWEEVE